MKRNVILMLVALFSLSMVAQNKPTKAEMKAAEKQQMEQLTQRYVTDFALQGEAAEKFGKIYADYNKKLREVNRLYKTPKVKRDQPMTEDEQEALILARFDRQRAILNMREFYYKKLRTVLTPSQVQKIYDDEKARKEELSAAKREHKKHK